MNVLWHEIRRRRMIHIVWCVAIVLFMVVGMVKFTTLTQDVATSQALMKQFPPTIQAIFGMTGLDITTLSGYFGVLFIYLLVLLSIHAGMLGASVLADEERDRTAEFLLVKPCSRISIVTQKLLAGTVYLVIVWLAVVGGIWLATRGLDYDQDFVRNVLNCMCAFAVVQLTFFMGGACIAAYARDPTTPSRYVAAVVCASYLFFALTKLTTTFDWLRYMSIFSYFDAVKMIADGSVSLGAVVVCGVLFVLMSMGTYMGYLRRDITV